MYYCIIVLLYYCIIVARGTRARLYYYCIIVARGTRARLYYCIIVGGTLFSTVIITAHRDGDQVARPRTVWRAPRAHQLTLAIISGFKSMQCTILKTRGTIKSNTIYNIF
jgi:hypothetical protein